MTSSNVVDHRSRVAAERREKMRRRLVESAMLVFAERGEGASVIQEVVAEAGVSQGTFYNYFRTNEELLIAVVEGLSNELMTLIETVVVSIEDPAARIATGLRLYLHTAKSYPILARFITGVRTPVLSPYNLIHFFLPPHIRQGMDQGRFVEVEMSVALNLIAGTVLATSMTFAADTSVSDSYPESMVEVILRGLGVDALEARRLVELPLVSFRLPADSLLARAQGRLSSSA